MLYRLRNTIARFMAGRYGTDTLNRFLLALYLLLWLVGLFLRGRPAQVLYLLSVLVLAYTLYRFLSRDLTRRAAENERFIRLCGRCGLRGWPHRQRIRLRDIGRFRYRRCPGCSAWLRLPIRRGRRTVTCSRCHTQFRAFFL